MKTLNCILLCVLPLVFSCRENPSNEMREPDKTIENVSGTLHYYNEMKMWGIYYTGHIKIVVNDGGDLYLIKETNKDLHFEEGKKVTISGSCYLAELAEDPLPVPAGTMVYYTLITNLTYE